MAFLNRLNRLACIGLIVCASTSTFANDLRGGKAPALSKNQISAPSIAALKKRCEEATFMTIPNRGHCDKVANTVKLSQSSFDYCQNKYKTERLAPFLECIEKADGRDYPTSYFDACKGARSSRNGAATICQDYLAQTDASFESEAFELCLHENSNKFEDAKPCFNAIRDRQVDVQGIKRACVAELSFGDKFIDCVYRSTDKAPANKNCVAATPSRPTAPVNPGTR